MVPLLVTRELTAKSDGALTPTEVTYAELGEKREPPAIRKEPAAKPTPIFFAIGLSLQLLFPSDETASFSLSPIKSVLRADRLLRCFFDSKN
jgi:hypothetical protein